MNFNDIQCHIFYPEDFVLSPGFVVGELLFALKVILYDLGPLCSVRPHHAVHASCLGGRRGLTARWRPHHRGSRWNLWATCKT